MGSFNSGSRSIGAEPRQRVGVRFRPAAQRFTEP
jgi:hypothetical protein